MARLWQYIVKGETGQALPAVLILLVLGGLLIAPSLSYASTSLNSSQAVVENTNGLYAADAGVEDTLWCLENGVPAHTSLSETLNGMAVTIQIEDKGEYNLCAGEWIEGSEHCKFLTVSTNMTWDGGAGAYKYTITVTRQPESSGNIKLTEVGARLPPGYGYQPGSAALFGNNISTGEPDDTLDQYGAHLLEWDLPPPYPELSAGDPTRTQIFYATGAGDLEGYYAWVVAQREDVGGLSEVIGNVYIITATATRSGGGEVITRVVADVVETGGEVHITSWQIKPY